MSYFGIRGCGDYGTGTDSDVTISTDVTLSRDMFYENLTITSTGILRPAGYRIFVRNLLKLDDLSLITAAGTNASAFTAGVTPNTGTFLSGSSGINGALVSASANASINAALGGSAGNGGKGGSGSSGAGSAATPPTADEGGIQIIKSLPYAMWGTTFASVARLRGGGGGGGGGGDGTNRGGGGGGGGGFVFISARIMKGSGIVSANGGNGGNGTAGIVGGGGGGGGGVTIIITDNNTSLEAFTVTADGGAAGLKFGVGGSDGSAGSAGNKVRIVCGV